MQVIEAERAAPAFARHDAPLDTEALYGESVTVYEESEGWAWAQLERDGYVGYLPSIALGSRDRADPPGRGAAHPRLSRARRSSSRRGWRCRSAPARRSSGRTAISPVTADGSWLWARHLADVRSASPDFVAVAEKFLKAPYLWGGRTSEGIDCSGLVQTGLTAAGIAAPRDSDMMEASLGEPVPPARRSRAAISSSGRATSASCATPRRCCTRTAGTWGRQRAARRGARPHRRQRRRRGDERAAAGAAVVPVGDRGCRACAQRTRRQRYFLPPMPRPAKRLLKRERRPPRSSSCCEPPVQAGWVLGSMSRCSVAPSSP